MSQKIIQGFKLTLKFLENFFSSSVYTMNRTIVFSVK